MVETIKLLGAFYSNHIPDIFYHAKNILLTGMITANIANKCIGNIVTAVAEFYFRPHISNGLAKMSYVINVLFDQVQY